MIAVLGFFAFLFSPGDVVSEHWCWKDWTILTLTPAFRNTTTPKSTPLTGFRKNNEDFPGRLRDLTVVYSDKKIVSIYPVCRCPVGQTGQERHQVEMKCMIRPLVPLPTSLTNLTAPNERLWATFRMWTCQNGVTRPLCPGRWKNTHRTQTNHLLGLWNRAKWGQKSFRIRVF